jgi:hypothetical protein
MSDKYEIIFCMSVIFRDVIFKHIKLLVHFSELLERLWSAQDTNLRNLRDASLGAFWAMWLFKYFPWKCYCGNLRKQEDVLCIAPTCNIGLLNIVDTAFGCCTVSTVGAGNIKEKKFGGSVWQGGNAACHNDFKSNVWVCMDCICVTQDRDWSHPFDCLIALGSITGNEGSSSPWC